MVMTRLLLLWCYCYRSNIALHSNRMRRATLDAMLEAVTSVGAPIAQRAIRLQARALGQTQLHPADLFAPAPSISGRGATKQKLMLYDDAIELIANAVSKVRCALL